MMWSLYVHLQSVWRPLLQFCCSLEKSCSLCRKAVKEQGIYSVGAGLLAYTREPYEEQLFEQTFLYRLSWAFKLSVSHKNFTLHFDIFKRYVWTSFCSFSCVNREYTQKPQHDIPFKGILRPSKALKKVWFIAKIFSTQPFSYLKISRYKSGRLLWEAGERNQSPVTHSITSRVEVTLDILISHFCQEKKLVFASIISLPFLLLSVPSTVNQSVLPSSVGNHCHLAPRKLYDADT